MMLIVVVAYVLVRRWNGDVVQLAAVAGVLALGYFAYSAYRSRQEDKRADRTEKADVAALEAKVESMFADVANRILDVEGRSGFTDTPEAGEHFHGAVTIFVSVDEKLDAAASSAQLRSISGELDEALWHLDATEALLDGGRLPTRSKASDIVRSAPDSISLSLTSRKAVDRWVDGGSARRRRRKRSC